MSYTWSSAEDNVSRFAGQVDDNGLGRNPADLLGLPLGFDPDREKGPADTDQPHRLVLSGTWRGPWRLTLSGIVSAASGIPFTPLAGADLNGDGLPTADRARADPANCVVGRRTQFRTAAGAGHRRHAAGASDPDHRRASR